MQAFGGLTETTQQINTDQLAQSLGTINDIAEKTPRDFRKAVTSVTALSNTISSRDEQIKTLLKNIDDVSGVLADRNTEFVKLFEDGGVLFQALTERRAAIHDVLVNVTAMSGEIDALVTDTDDDLQPALAHLAGVVEVLRKNQRNIDSAIEQLPDYYAMVANNSGNGPWLDGYLTNLLEIMGVG